METATASLAVSAGQYVSFTLGAEEFGIELLKVREIIRYQALTRVPSAPAGVEGVISLRGSIVPVVDLRCRLDLPQHTPDRDTRILIVDFASGTTGFIVDRVRHIVRVDPEMLEPVPELAGSAASGYVRGVARLPERLLLLIDLEQVVAQTRVEAAA